LGAEAPEGYTSNNGCVSHLVPIEEGLLVQAKWVKLCNNGAVELLSGRSKDEEPYVVNLYTSPDYTTKEPIELLPAWFNYLINGPAPEYHAFHDAMARLNKWEYLAEVECLHRYIEKQCEICDKINLLNSELQYMDDKFAACHHHIEAARISEMVHSFKQRPA
jgi:hypothetical protein